MKLKICPFCCSTDAKLDATDGRAAVECRGCGARGPVYGDEETPIAERRESAERSWNYARRMRP